MNKTLTSGPRLPFLLLAFTVLAATALSCNKIDASIQRDLTFSADETKFTIPVINTLDNGIVAGNFPATINLEQKIRAATDGQFGAEDLTNIRIASFKMELTLPEKDTVDAANNLGNLEVINVELRADPYKVTIARTEANSVSNIRSVSMGGAVDSPDLKTILLNNFRYDIRVKARKVTTETMEARVLPVFRATVRK